ncbi:MAG: N-acetylglucosamine-6-phosphate deacetylase [Victivallales bacterium]|nr:N-acetylglucosamine-6-phosphate deacetylase [Victivallales bacterium]
MSVLLKNAHVISPDVDITEAAVYVEGTQIQSVIRKGEALPKAEQEYDACGNYVMPGFLDAHFHGGMGYETTTPKPEAMGIIAEAKLKEGVTSMCPTTLTLSQEMLVESLSYMEAYKRRQAFAKIVGIHLEGPYINPECLGAQNPAFVRPPNIAEVKALNAISKVALITYAPEMPGADAFTKELLAAGICPIAGHTSATYAQFQACHKNGLARLTHFCNQMTKLHHREIGMVGAGLLEPDVAIEMICDKIHLAPDMIRLCFQVKNIDKILLITDCMEATGLPDGDYQLGGLAVVVKDGAARLKSNNALAGSTLQMNRALQNVFEVTGLPLKELVKTTSWNQARNLGLSGIGKVEAGYTADLTVLDANFHVQATFVDGALKFQR